MKRLRAKYAPAEQLLSGYDRNEEVGTSKSDSQEQGASSNRPAR